MVLGELKLFLRHIYAQYPILDKKGEFMFFANRKACIHSIARHKLKKRAFIRKDAKQRWHKLFNQTDYEKAFKFTVVRNPYDKVVSAFFALQQLSKRGTISEEETFQHFVKTTLKKIGPSFDRHFEIQYPRVYFNNKIYVNYIARFENIKKDWIIIANTLGCSKTLPHKNKSKHDLYRKYYDKESKAIIKEIYKQDLELFGYAY